MVILFRGTKLYSVLDDVWCGDEPLRNVLPDFYEIAISEQAIVAQ